MNNKGFTLTELLAIVAIIAIIGVIAVPSMSRQIKQEESANQRLLNNKIENAAHLYAAKYHADDIITCASGKAEACPSFTLEALQQDGLLSLKSTECSGLESKSILIEFIDLDSDGLKEINYDYSDITPGCYN